MRPVFDGIFPGLESVPCVNAQTTAACEFIPLLIVDSVAEAGMMGDAVLYTDLDMNVLADVRHSFPSPKILLQPPGLNFEFAPKP